ncbi:hypothetical protein HZS_1577 [Henneguya salminicola]|nr:hypothetical protein HZS_1577 [Henneguya salminicola]
MYQKCHFNTISGLICSKLTASIQRKMKLVNIVICRKVASTLKTKKSYNQTANFSFESIPQYHAMRMCKHKLDVGLKILIVNYSSSVNTTLGRVCIRLTQLRILE